MKYELNLAINFHFFSFQNLYESFVTARDREERGRPDKPRQGNTIFVAGHNITEDFLRKEFQRFGNIVNVTMEIEKK